MHYSDERLNDLSKDNPLNTKEYRLSKLKLKIYSTMAAFCLFLCLTASSLTIFMNTVIQSEEYKAFIIIGICTLLLATSIKCISVLGNFVAFIYIRYFEN
jgi:hypothetical protein